MSSGYIFPRSIIVLTVSKQEVEDIVEEVKTKDSLLRWSVNMKACSQVTLHVLNSVKMHTGKKVMFGIQYSIDVYDNSQ
jgi:hypothetical protein